MARSRRRAYGHVEERVGAEIAPGVHAHTYRARWSCSACQADSDAAWRVARGRAQMRGEASPARARVQHSTRWVPTRAEAEDVLEQARKHNAAGLLGGLGDLCWLDDVEDDGRRNDQRSWGKSLHDYAERILTRTSGAPTTRAQDRAMYEEDVNLPAISDRPLGIRDRWGAAPVASISRRDVRTWLREVAARPGKQSGSSLSPSQVRQRFYLLRRILREAVNDEAITLDPSTDIRPPSLPHGRAVTGLMRAQEDGRWLPTEEQVLLIVKQMPERSRLAAALCVGLGLRAGEVTALEVGDLTREGRDRFAVRIARSESQTTGGRLTSDTKNHQAHTRHAPEWVGAEIQEHLARHALKPGDRLLPSVGQKKAVSISHSTIRNDLRKALAELGMEPLSTQDLRAIGEAHVAARIGRPDAAEWARHGLAVQMQHYVGVERERTSRAAAGWGEKDG